MRMWLVTGSLLALATTYRADPPGATTPVAPEPSSGRGSYSLPQAHATLVPTALVGVGPLIGGSPGDALTEVGAVGFAGAGPAVHFIHHRYGDGAASIAFRIALRLLGMLVGSAGQSCTSAPNSIAIWPCNTEGLWLGALAGMAATDAIDIAFLAHGDAGVPPSNAPPLPALPPLASPTPHELHVAVAFSF